MVTGEEPEFAAPALLQAEAQEVVDALQLPESLKLAGRPVQVGSSVLALMTWRDIDFHAYCDPLNPDMCYESLRPIASLPGTIRVAFFNRQGSLRQPNEPEGYYSGIRYRASAGHEWKIDVWFVASGAPHPELEMMRRMQDLLTPERRLSILRLKSIWHTSPFYRDTVTSQDIYDAVIDRGVMMPDEFEKYLQRAGKLG